ncbi:MAG: flavin reductase family protein [Sediminimonas qiaohouensis]|uniref:Flavin reductase family protein n=1 Tax=Sediminimonas qiaohouensis TaxID=552061 RepID=A0A7C9LLC0_9RHOB|nr:flavin reductase family protein [Sediminimonas qiaohouensis]MTJ03380.1 flavin reductase family protein [Sediminimonas qiaohouensis]
MTAFDPRALRNAFGSFMTGVTVVTTRAPDGTPVGFTANSFCSVSLDPPLLLVCPGKFLSSFDAFHNAGQFAVSVLAEGQEDVSNTFASRKEDRFAATRHRLDRQGIPVIDGAVAQFSCAVRRAIPAGDHSILLGEVIDYDHAGGAGLGYGAGRYFSLGLEREAGTRQETGAVVGAIVETDDGVLLDETPDGLRPPQVTVQGCASQLETLGTGLTARGIAAEFGLAYSAFDDRRLGVHHTYVLARATGRAPEGGTRCVAPEDLPAQRYTTPAIATMMRRFALETRTRTFTLYLGDEGPGDTQP